MFGSSISRSCCRSGARHVLYLCIVCVSQLQGKVFIKGFKFDRQKIATRFQDRLDGPDDPRIENFVIQVMCDIKEEFEYALEFRIGGTADGVAIFIVYDEADDQAELDARELGSIEPVIWSAERQFLAGPAVWKIERVY